MRFKVMLEVRDGTTGFDGNSVTKEVKVAANDAGVLHVAAEGAMHTAARLIGPLIDERLRLRREEKERDCAPLLLNPANKDKWAQF